MMNIQREQAQQFHANFQRLERNIERIDRNSLELRNFFVVVLLQLALFSILLNAYWLN
jgi:hypothetical protein